MAQNKLIELTDRELDAVAAGANNVGAAQAGLVNANVQATDVLSHNTLLNNNHTDVAVSVLGIAGA